MTKTELLLLLIGGIFVIEALSVILQVFTFKYWGRRIFLMAPIHHHFEMKAWSETKIMVRFWILAAILCAARLRPLLPLLPRLPLSRCAERARPRARAVGAGGGAGARRRGVEVSASTRAGRGRREACEAGVEVHLGTEETRCSTASRLLIKSPGVPGEAPLVVGARARGIPVWSEVELGYAAPAEPDRRRHRDEREDDDERAARRDARRARWPATSAAR